MSDMPIETQVPALPALEAGWLARRLSRLLLSRIKIGTLTIVTPGGMRLSHGGGNGPDGVMILHRWRTLRRLLFQGDVSFAEAYMDGDWESPDLPALIELAGRNMPTLTDAIDGTWAKRLRNRIIHRLNANTRRGSRRNITHHYDLGNDFYRAWLDSGMSYSSAYYTHPDQSLEDAQAAKQARAVELLDVTGGERVLEIGCGWGGLAEKLAREADCHVTGLTLSAAQLDYSVSRLAGPDVAPKTELRLQDYRDVSGRFDRIVSIEMMEAVGETYWPSYFGTLRERLKPGGVAVIQAITIAEVLFQDYKRCPDFIQRYIFPGGMLPTITEIRRQTTQAGLVLRSAETFGLSYARTLAEWRRRFHAAWPDIQRQGFDTRFRRMWDYYLAYCEGGFRSGNIDVGLYVLERPA
jgi:cyclopropane-fatty-acyl-phospholipid synthase